MHIMYYINIMSTESDSFSKLSAPLSIQQIIITIQQIKKNSPVRVSLHILLYYQAVQMQDDVPY